jgi:hypothetical protein
MRDLDVVFPTLARSAFRRKFRLQGAELAYLEEHGLDTVLTHARDLLTKRIVPPARDRDGKQTPYRGHPVFVAQHATATCCRACLEKWHGIPRGREMNGEELDHAVSAIERWLRAAPRS